MNRDPANTLCDAIRRGNATALRQLLLDDPLARGCINDAIGPFGGRPLTMAMQFDVVEALLDFGADPNLPSDWSEGGFVPLDGKDEQTAKLLLERGATLTPHAAAAHGWLDELRNLLDRDAMLVHQKGGDGTRPLHWAKDASVVDFLLDRLADVDARCTDHLSTPLQYLVKASPAAAKRLLERGATTDIFTSAALGDTVRLAEELHRSPQLLSQRIGDAGYNRAAEHTVLQWKLGHRKLVYVVARENGQPEAADLVLDLATPAQRLISHAAAGEIDQAQPYQSEVTSLSQESHGGLAIAVFFGQTTVAEAMIELGFDPAAPGIDGGNALHAVAWVGHAGLLQKLLTLPAIASIVNEADPTHGSTPLGWALLGSHMRNAPGGDYAACVRLLKAAGASTGLQGNAAGRSLESMAGGRADVLPVLRER